MSSIEVRKAKIAHKEKQLVGYEDHLKKLSDKSRAKTKELAMNFEMAKSARVANVRHRTHHLTVAMDSVLRGPDQSNDIRTYSKMDADIWKYEDVRHWFNKNAPTDPNSGAYTKTPAETGYVIRVN